MFGIFPSNASEISLSLAGAFLGAPVQRSGFGAEHQHRPRAPAEQRLPWGRPSCSGKAGNRGARWFIAQNKF